MRIHYIQHEPFETPGSIIDWAGARGFPLTRTLAYLPGAAEAAFPSGADFDWLVIMGGSMNVYEERAYPWLAAEKKFIRAAIDAGKTVLGLCLGAQLTACVLGGRVTRNPYPEIGWLPISLTPEARADRLFSFLPENPVVFHWHGDTFSELPPGAVLLASSAACAHQAFIWGGRVIGFQFHLENTAPILEGLVKNCAAEMVPGPYVQTPEEVLAHPGYMQTCVAWMEEFLTRLAGI
jgi:GMP synthase-like glutamine amidotransferase